MGDDLRTRIAQTIYGDGNSVSWACALALADLIIWELGLRLETVYAWSRGRSVKTGNRYVTDWQGETDG